MEKGQIKKDTYSISVVIPNYNGKKLLEANLPSVLKAVQQCFNEFEIIIPDDASNDDSVSFLEKQYPFIEVIRSKKNEGFSANINKGIRKASKDLVLALNSDVQLSENYFNDQLKYFSNKDTFGVMGRIIGLYDEIIQDAAKYPTWKFISVKSTVNYLPKNSKNTGLPTLYLSGANALMDRIKLQELGGFDELFSPFYLEDLDLSVSAWRVGWKSYYEHNSICRHLTSNTITKYNKRKRVKIISLRNKFLFHLKQLDGKLQFYYISKIYLELFFRILTFQTYYIKAFYFYLKKGDKIKDSRIRLNMVFKKHQTKKSIPDILEEIKILINNREIIKF